MVKVVSVGVGIRAFPGEAGTQDSKHYSRICWKEQDGHALMLAGCRDFGRIARQGLKRARKKKSAPWKTTIRRQLLLTGDYTPSKVAGNLFGINEP